jgi:hypothetical protein
VIVPGELASGALRLVATTARVPDLGFVASWLAAPDTQTVERVAQIAVETAADQGARHRWGMSTLRRDTLED